MRSLVFLSLLLSFSPSLSLAQGAAPELFGVREIIVNYVKFSDPAAADTCGLSREEIMTDIIKAFTGTNVPAFSIADAKPPSLGVARIELQPEIYAHTDENLNCISFVSLTAQNRANVLVPPVSTLRGVTVVYWQQHTFVTSSQSTHVKLVDGLVQKMAAQFAQQYRLDQPPDLAK